MSRKRAAICPLPPRVDKYADSPGAYLRRLEEEYPELAHEFARLANAHIGGPFRQLRNFQAWGANALSVRRYFDPSTEVPGQCKAAAMTSIVVLPIYYANSAAVALAVEGRDMCQVRSSGTQDVLMFTLRKTFSSHSEQAVCMLARFGGLLGPGRSWWDVMAMALQLVCQHVLALPHVLLFKGLGSAGIAAIASTTGHTNRISNILSVNEFLFRQYGIPYLTLGVSSVKWFSGVIVQVLRLTLHRVYALLARFYDFLFTFVVNSVRLYAKNMAVFGHYSMTNHLHRTISQKFKEMVVTPLTRENKNDAAFRAGIAKSIAEIPPEEDVPPRSLLEGLLDDLEEGELEGLDDMDDMDDIADIQRLLDAAAANAAAASLGRGPVADGDGFFDASS